MKYESILSLEPMKLLFGILYLNNIGQFFSFGFWILKRLLLRHFPPLCSARISNVQYLYLLKHETNFLLHFVNLSSQLLLYLPAQSRLRIKSIFYQTTIENKNLIQPHFVRSASIRKFSTLFERFHGQIILKAT